MQNFILIDLFLPQHRNTIFPESSRCFAVCCSSLLQAQIEIAPRSQDGFLQLFEGRKSTRRQAGGISSSRGTGCKTLLLVWPSETCVCPQTGQMVITLWNEEHRELIMPKGNTGYDQSGTLKCSAHRNTIFFNRSLHLLHLFFSSN